jgi:hypothetical protein
MDVRFQNPGIYVLAIDGIRESQKRHAGSWKHHKLPSNVVIRTNLQLEQPVPNLNAGSQFSPQNIRWGVRLVDHKATRDNDGKKLVRNSKRKCKL